MWVSAFFIITLALYLTAWTLELASVFRPYRGARKLSAILVGGAACAHLAYIAFEYYIHRHSPLADLNGSLAALSLGVIVALLLIQQRKKIPSLGIFIIPITLVFLLGAALIRGVAEVPERVASALLQVHIAFNVSGLIAFTLAAAAALAYIVQEHLLRKKRIVGAFQQLPSLEVLDNVSARASQIGFPLLTAGVITGAVFITRAGSGAFWGSTQTIGILTWIVFAFVLVLRLVGGYRGKRAALGTLIGFACGVSVLAAYALRIGGGV